MTISGTVSKVIRRATPHGSVYLTVDIDGSRLRYLQTFQPVPRRGDKITLEGMPIMGRKSANVGAVSITIHDRP
jgi:hypothetical protein